MNKNKPPSSTPDQGALKFFTGLGVVGWFLGGQKSTRVGQFLCVIFLSCF
jgi:hypothetical protein